MKILNVKVKIETKKELINIQADLMKKKGKKVSLNDTIKHLIQQSKKK